LPLLWQAAPGVYFGHALLAGCAVFFLAPMRTAAQETPYFVAYSHHLEEPGNLEIAFNSTYGTQHRGNDFVAPWLELEYGVTAWWTFGRLRPANWRGCCATATSRAACRHGRAFPSSAAGKSSRI